MRYGVGLAARSSQACLAQLVVTRRGGVIESDELEFDEVDLEG